MTLSEPEFSPFRMDTQPAMPIVLTSILKIADWKAWRVLHRDLLIQQARQAGASRYAVYRNINDASQTLILVEFANQQAAREMGRALNEISGRLAGGLSDDRAWEPTGWEDI